jgi:hypothetical protein
MSVPAIPEKIASDTVSPDSVMGQGTFQREGGGTGRHQSGKQKPAQIETRPSKKYAATASGAAKEPGCSPRDPVGPQAGLLLTTGPACIYHLRRTGVIKPAWRVVNGEGMCRDCFIGKPLNETAIRWELYASRPHILSGTQSPSSMTEEPQKTHRGSPPLLLKKRAPDSGESSALKYKENAILAS